MYYNMVDIADGLSVSALIEMRKVVMGADCHWNRSTFV